MTKKESYTNFDYYKLSYFSKRETGVEPATLSLEVQKWLEEQARATDSDE